MAKQHSISDDTAGNGDRLSGNLPQLLPPSLDEGNHQMLDYVTIIILMVCFLAGAPLNLALFFRTLEKIRVISAAEWLKFQLVISHLLVLFVYVVSKILWHISFDWYAGTTMCKIVKFGHEFSFQSTSAILACIAFDRFLMVVRPFASETTINRRVRYMVVFAWLYSAICSSPQYAIFTVYLVPYNNYKPQCTSWWKIWKSNNETTDSLVILQHVQSSFHVLSIFWLPFLLMCVCYAVIARHIWLWYRAPPVRKQKPPKVAITAATSSTPSDAPQFRRSSKKAARTKHANSPVHTNNTVIVINENKKKSDPAEVALLQCTLKREMERQMHARAHAHLIQTLRSTLVLLTTYFICWLPYHIGAVQSSAKRNVVQILELMMIFTSVINPFTYGLLQSSMFCCCGDCWNLMDESYSDEPDENSKDPYAANRRRTSF